MPLARLSLLLALAVLLAVPPSAGAQRTLGSPLSNAPNAFGCETRPTFTSQSYNGDYFFLPSGQPDCTWWQAGDGGAPSSPITGAVPGDGLVTRVAVRSGPNPAALRFVVMRLFADSASGSRQCCFFVDETRVVQPRPNRVTRFAVNLRVERNTNPNNGLVTQDYVGVSAVSGTGLLPLFSNGRHNTLRDYFPGNPVAGFFYPRFGRLPSDDPNAGGRREEAIPGFEVLLRWTWTARAATLPGRRLVARNGVVGLPVRCLLSRACRGRARLLTRPGGGGAAARSRLLGSTRIKVRAGRTARVRVRLNRRGRRLMARRPRAKLLATVKLRVGGTLRRKVTVRRAGG